MGQGSLAVVMTGVDGDEAVTDRISNLVVRNSSPGGYESVEFDMQRRLAEKRIPDGTVVRVFDATTGEQVGGGRVIEPGPAEDGIWRVSCLGEGFAALQDQDEPYMVVDASLQPTVQPSVIGVREKTIGGKQYKMGKNGGRASVPKQKVITGIVSATAKVAGPPDGTETEGLLFEIPQGTSTSASAVIAAQIRTPYLCGQRLGAFIYRYVCGITSSSYTLRADALTFGGGSDTVATHTFTQSSPAGVWKVHGTDFDSTRDWFQLRVVTGAATTTLANVWAHARTIVLRTQLFAADGSVRSGASVASLTAGVHDVFTDLVVRRCPSLKVGTVTTGARAFTQLAWYDGATAKDILDELCEADGTVTYHAWEADAAGRTAINLDPVTTAVRYEVNSKDGYNAPTSSGDVYDRVVVTAPDPAGFTRRQVVSRNTNGRPRSKTINLDAWPTEGLTAVGNQFLDKYAAPPNGGVVVVGERVRDLTTGRWVHPAAIKSGNLIRVLGVQPNPDSLNPDAKRDGVTIFRIASNTYTADSGTATLELDQPVLNQDRALAALLSS